MVIISPRSFALGPVVHILLGHLSINGTHGKVLICGRPTRERKCRIQLSGGYADDKPTRDVCRTSKRQKKLLSHPECPLSCRIMRLAAQGQGQTAERYS